MGGIAKDLYERSSSAYCMYIQKMQSDECLGWEYKVRSGKFTKANLEAHTKAGELLGRHRALHEAADLVKSATPETAAERDRYRKALQEIANGDGCYGAQAHEYKQIAKSALYNPLAENPGDISEPPMPKEWDAVAAERDRLLAENERLREVLEKIADNTHDEESREIARAALAKAEAAQ